MSIAKQKATQELITEIHQWGAKQSKHLDAYKRHIDVVAQLLTQGADPNTHGKPRGEWTFLGDGGNYVRYSATAQACLEQARDEGQLAVSISVSTRKFSVDLQAMSQVDDVTGAQVAVCRQEPTPEQRGEPILIASARYGDVDSTRLLVEHGAMLDNRDSKGSTALLAICGLGESVRSASVSTRRAVVAEATDVSFDKIAAMVKILVEAGADIRAQDRLGRTALVRAAQRGDCDLSKLLLNLGAIGKKCDLPQLSTAMAEASAAGHTSVVRSLVIVTEPCPPGQYKAAEMRAAKRTELTHLLHQRDSLAAEMRNNAEKYQLKSSGRVEQFRDERARQNQLVDAIRDDNCAAVHDLLSQGVALNRVSSDTTRESPLIAAARHQNIALVEELLALGAPLDARDAWGATVFSHATRAKNLTLLNKLLYMSLPWSQQQHNTILRPNARWALNIADCQGYTPLIIATAAPIHEDSNAIIKLLIEARSNLDSQNIQGWSALLWATKQSNCYAVTLLLDAGADPLTRTGRSGKNYIQSALELARKCAQNVLAQMKLASSKDSAFLCTLAARLQRFITIITRFRRNPEMIEELELSEIASKLGKHLQNTEPDGNPQDKHVYRDKLKNLIRQIQQGLEADATKRQIKAVPLLVDTLWQLRPTINIGSIHDVESQCHHIAAKAEQLLLNGANPCSRDSNGVTALNCSVACACAAVSDPRYNDTAKHLVSTLLDYKANVNLPSRSGVTPLMAALLGGDPVRCLAMARSLLCANADVNIQHKVWGYTALHIAVQTGNVDGVQLLLDEGKCNTLETRTKAGQTALEAAAVRGDYQIVQLLVAHGAKPTGSVNGANISSRIQTMLNDLSSQSGDTHVIRRQNVSQTMFEAQRLRQALGLGRETWFAHSVNNDGVQNYLKLQSEESATYVALGTDTIGRLALSQITPTTQPITRAPDNSAEVRVSSAAFLHPQSREVADAAARNGSWLQSALVFEVLQHMWVRDTIVREFDQNGKMKHVIGSIVPGQHVEVLETRVIQSSSEQALSDKSVTCHRIGDRFWIDAMTPSDKPVLRHPGSLDVDDGLSYLNSDHEDKRLQSSRRFGPLAEKTVKCLSGSVSLASSALDSTMQPPHSTSGLWNSENYDKVVQIVGYTQVQTQGGMRKSLLLAPARGPVRATSEAHKPSTLSMLERDFLSSVAAGKVNDVEQAIDCGVNIDVVNETGTAALHLAAQYDHAVTVQLLCQRGADIRILRASDSASSLCIAASSGHLSVASALLAAIAADKTNAFLIDQRNKNGCTPLCLALMGSHAKIATTLLMAGASASSRSGHVEHGFTPLHHAARMGLLPILLGTCLLDDIEEVREHQKQVVRLISSSAAAKQRLDKLSIRLRELSDQVNDIKVGSSSFAKDRAKLARLELDPMNTRLKLLSTQWQALQKDRLSAESDLERAREHWRNWWLHGSRQLQQEWQRIVDYRCGPIGSDNQNTNSCTALQLACEHGHLSSVKVLVNQLQANPFQPMALHTNMQADGIGWSPLYIAAKHGNRDIVKFLLGQEGT